MRQLEHLRVVRICLLMKMCIASTTVDKYLLASLYRLLHALQTMDDLTEVAVSEAIIEALGV